MQETIEIAGKTGLQAVAPQRKPQLGGQRAQGLSPGSAMEAMLCGVRNKLPILVESRFLICKVETIRLLISKVEICIIG